MNTVFIRKLQFEKRKDRENTPKHRKSMRNLLKVANTNGMGVISIFSIGKSSSTIRLRYDMTHTALVVISGINV